MGTIMTTSECVAMIIQRTETKKEMIKKMLERLWIKNIAIVDIKCVCMKDYFLQKQIYELKKDSTRFKLFHGGNVEIFNNMVESFSLKERKDFKYQEILEEKEVMVSFWKFCSLVPFPHTFSPIFSLGKEEI